MLQVKVENDNSLRFVSPVSNTGLAVVFQRTLRIPDDGKTYPLPPGFGAFPVRRVLDYKSRVPAGWVKTSGVFLPMYQREAMWIAFQSRPWRPSAVKVAAGKINAVSGSPWNQKLAPPSPPGMLRGILGSEPLQDYLTCPPQPWLDGFNTGEGTIRQFVAMPLGMGYTVEGQVTGKEEHGGIQMIVYEPRPGRFPEMPPPPPPMAVRSPGPAGAFGGGGPPMGALLGATMMAPAPAAGGRAMGLAAGGTMKQKIYPDPYGVEAWDEANHGRVFVHIVNSVMWTEITGEAPPPTPVSPRSYSQAGYPWFQLYDEGLGDVAPSPVLQAVHSVAGMDAQHGFVGVDDNTGVDLTSAQVRGISRNDIPDGDW